MHLNRRAVFKVLVAESAICIIAGTLWLFVSPGPPNPVAVAPTSPTRVAPPTSAAVTGTAAVVASNVAATRPEAEEPSVIVRYRIDIRLTTASAVIDKALQAGDVETKLAASMTSVYCGALDGIDQPIAFEGQALPSISASFSDDRRRLLTAYQAFCGAVGVNELAAFGKQLQLQLSRVPGYAQTLRTMSEDRPWAQEQVQAAIVALTDPLARPVSVYQFLTRAVSSEMLQLFPDSQTEAARMLIYRELTGDDDLFSMPNAFGCVTHNVCGSAADIAEAYPTSVAAAQSFVQAVKRQDWRALKLQ